jgi:hypothetical protein
MLVRKKATLPERKSKAAAGGEFCHLNDTSSSTRLFHGRFGKLTGVADKEVEAPKTAARSRGIKLSKPSRTFAFILGLAGLGAGGAAVYLTQVEAGPVGLMASSS